MATAQPFGRQELETFWRSRLIQARECYLTAMEESRKALDEQHHRLSPYPDTQALQLILQVETDARAEYARVLRIFTDLVVYGKSPDALER